jgi:hypothetical protein
MFGGHAIHAQQFELTLQGGIHAARLERPERIGSAPGEATTLGLRVGRRLSAHWGFDAGAAWSRNRSYPGSATLPPPEAYNETVFTSATLWVRPTARTATISISGGLGPALIFHGGDGISLLTRQTDLGAVLAAVAEARVWTRIGFRIDVQHYLFSSSFAQAYPPPLARSPVQPPGEQFRREWVMMAGATLHFGG